MTFHHPQLLKYRKALIILLIINVYSNPSHAQSPTANFSHSTSYKGFTIQFYDSSSADVDQWTWHFGDGSKSHDASPLHSFASAGTYQVCLYVSNSKTSASDSFCSNVAVSNTCHDAIVNISVGIGQQILKPRFYTPSTKYTWEFGDKSATATGYYQKFQYSHSGHFTVRMYSVDSPAGCRDTAVSQILVSSNCKALFSTGKSTTNGYLAEFTNLTTGLGPLFFSWSFGDGGQSKLKDPSHEYLTEDTYPVKLVVQDSAQTCKDSVTYSVNIKDNCKANMNWEMGSTPLDLQFWNKSTGKRLKYKWDFGVYGMSQKENPTVSFPTAGSYSFKLVIVDSIGGCKDSMLTHALVAGYCDVAVKDSSLGSDPLNIGFSLSPKPGKWASGEWVIDNTQVYGNATNPSFKFGHAGYYPITVTYRNGYGCVSTTSKKILVGTSNPCVAYYLYSELYTTRGVAFSLRGKGGNYQWDFGDGQLDTVSNPVHTYAKRGKYQVCLLASNTTNSCNDAFCDTVEIHDSCANSFKANVDLYWKTVSFNVMNHKKNNRYFFDYGDGHTEMLYYNDYSTKYSYKKVGKYEACLYTQDTSEHCREKWCDTVAIDGYLKAEFKTKAISNLVIEFTNKSRGYASNDQLSYLWDYGDGTTSTISDEVHQHEYWTDGRYNVKLTVSDTINGMVDSFIQSDWIASICYVKPERQRFNQSHDVMLSLNKSEAVNYWVWYLPNGDTSHSLNKLITLPDSLPVKIAYEYGDTLGRCKLKTDTIYVSASGYCKANFEWHTTDKLGEISFSNTSNGPLYQDTTIWYLYPNKAYTQYSNHTLGKYSKPGFYKVTMFFTNYLGCSDSVTKRIEVKFCQADFKYARINSITGHAELLNTSKGDSLSYYWDFGDGNSSNSKIESHSYSKSGIYNICLAVQNTSCRDTHCLAIDLDTFVFDLDFVDSLPIMPNSIEEVNPTSIYPNPFDAYITIETELAGNVQLSDLTGRHIDVPISVSNGKTVINTSALLPGVYMLVLRSGSGQVLQEKVIKLSR